MTVQPLAAVNAAVQVRLVESWQDVWVGDRRVEALTVGVGEPLLFLHGWGLSPRTYLPGLRRIALSGRQVTALTLPGFGRSQAPRLSRNASALSSVARHLGRALEELGLDAPVDMVAHSFGCGVALRIAAERPQAVASLTLLCPVGGAASGVHPLPAVWFGLLKETLNPRLVHRAVSDFVPALLRNPMAVSVAGLSARYADSVADVRLAVKSGVKVHMVFADRDAVVRPGDLPFCVPGLSVAIVRGQHSWMITDPDRFAATVLQQLGSQDALALAV